MEEVYRTKKKTRFPQSSCPLSGGNDIVQKKVFFCEDNEGDIRVHTEKCSDKILATRTIWFARGEGGWFEVFIDRKKKKLSKVG